MANQQQTALRTKSKIATARPKRAGPEGYYQIQVLPRTGFESFQTQPVGRQGRIQRVTGQRASGYWSTVVWLIGKNEAHIQGNKLIPDTKEARNVIEQLGSEPVRMLGNLFKARPRPGFQEAQPTPDNGRGRRPNAKKARSGRRKN